MNFRSSLSISDPTTVSIGFIHILKSTNLLIRDHTKTYVIQLQWIFKMHNNKNIE